MSILLGVVLLFAVLSGAVAAVQAVAINRVPAGQWRGWLLGWWRFGEIEQRAGSAEASRVNIYKRAVIACLIFVVFGLILSGWATSQRSDGGLAAATNLNLRSVATMPGATSLES